ncbi:CvpA family protein [Croceitalea sp. P059]|uniref:CvpA family protein n=1 Tax=Croceitalea sp. P059 TaxID=3075601 RepID=UPI0028850B2A|nr:CvpA family protein [Croceitalea sp. P059]MDT0538516.1 CvpA family protein [Croceitalea sp. P059]
MSFIDIVLGILLIWGLYKGLKNGLFVELASLVALIAGIYGSIHFSYIASDYLSENMDWNDRYIKIASFLITFIAIVLIVNLAGKFLTKIADFAMLGLLNKIAGAIFGALKVAVILGALLIFFEKATSSFNFVNEETQTDSILYKPIRDIGDFVFSTVLKEKPNTTSEE